MPTQPTAPAALPTTPDPDDRATFRARAYPWSVALTTFSTDLTALATNCFANATEAAASAAIAAAQAAAAQAAIGSSIWVSGADYAYGVSTWSPTNGRTYRRKVAGISTIDPSFDPVGWWDISIQPAVPLVDISTNTSASVAVVYRMLATLTLTLPASPSIGDWVAFINSSSTQSCTISRNGQKIMGLSEDMTINYVFAANRLVYTGSVSGWVFG